MVVERDSQKPIMMARTHIEKSALGPAAQIEALLGTPVHLDLKVKVLKEWQRDPKHLNHGWVSRRPPSPLRSDPRALNEPPVREAGSESGW